MKEIKNFIFLSLIFLIFIQLTACYTSVEGCLDPESTNYSINGDDPCDDCCKYPLLKVSIFHENADTTFNLNDTITNDLGQQISLLDFVYLLSDFEVLSQDSIYEVSDTVSLNVDDGTLRVKDDVVRVSRSDFTFDVGTIIYDGSTSELRFQTGISDLLNENSFTTAIEDHPLTSDADSLYQVDTETYVFQRLKVAQGVDFLDTVIYDVRTAAEVVIPIEFESVRGEDKTILIEAQYDKWFEGIDFNTLQKSEIESAIGLNSSSLFREKN